MLKLKIEELYDTTMQVSLQCDEDVISECVCCGIVKDGGDVEIKTRYDTFHLHCIDRVIYNHFRLKDGFYFVDEYELVRDGENCTKCTKKSTCCMKYDGYGYCKDYVRITCANCKNRGCNEPRLDDRYCGEWME